MLIFFNADDYNSISEMFDIKSDDSFENKMIGFFGSSEAVDLFQDNPSIEAKLAIIWRLPLMQDHKINIT